MLKGFTDVPVFNIDHDFLDIKVYIDCLCEFIMECDTPMTISIQGDWGSGKTSIMNMIKCQVSDKVLPIWFNTWQYSQFEMQQYLTISLITNIINELEVPKEKVDKLSGLLMGTVNAVKGIAKFGATTIAEQTIGQVNAQKVDNYLFGTQNINDLANELKNLKQKLEEAVAKKLAKENKNRLIIFIDDLDRLAPEKAVEFLEVLKNFLDIKKCVFLLAVDYEVVTQGIKKKYGAELGEAKGKSFFDKMIQLPFAVPISNYDINKYLKTFLGYLKIEQDETNLELYKNLINYSIGFNPRSVKRLFNNFMLLNRVAEHKNIFQHDIANNQKRLLFASLCLQLAYEEVYEYLLNHQEEMNAEVLYTLCDSKKIKSSKDLEGFRACLKKSDDKYYENLSNFFEHYYSAIDFNFDSDVSNDEFNYLWSALKLTSITSHNEEASKSNRPDYLSNFQSFVVYYLQEKKYNRNVLVVLNAFHQKLMKLKEQDKNSTKIDIKLSEKKVIYRNPFAQGRIKNFTYFNVSTNYLKIGYYTKRPRYGLELHEEKISIEHLENLDPKSEDYKLKAIETVEVYWSKIDTSFKNFLCD